MNPAHDENNQPDTHFRRTPSMLAHLLRMGGDYGHRFSDCSKHANFGRSRKIRALLNREDVQHQLETYGISHEEALARVNSLTDAEISALVKEIGDVPAGGQLEAVVYAAILAVMLALYLPGLLFKTIECIFSDCEYKGGLSYVFRAWWKDEPISPQVKAGFCFNNCNSDYNECINTDNGENIQKSQCEIEKQLCDKQCDVAFDKDVREDTTREDTTEEDCDPGMESCP